MPKLQVCRTAVFLSFCAIPTSVFAHSYGPAARYTGAPGDDSRACTACHGGGALNSGLGSLKILLQSGAFYIPGVKQRVTIQISDPVQQRWGFELTARLNSDPEKGQAGSLSPVDNLTQVICEDNAPTPCPSGVSFIQHTSAGTRLGTKGGATFQFDWTPPDTNVGPVTFYAAGNAANGNGSSAGDLIYTSSVQLAPAIPAAPAVSAGNIVSAATFSAGPVAPNGWVTVYGTNLGVTTRSWNDSDFADGGMPVSLDGVSVIITANGAPRRAYVGFVSPGQVNFLLPTDTSPTTVQVQIRNSAGISAQMPLTVQANAPQLLTLDGKNAVAFHSNGSIVGKTGLLGSVPTTPATPGETITFYCTGGGATSPALIPGQVPVAAVGVATLPTVNIGSSGAAPLSASVLPGTGGVYQVSAQVPASAQNGDLPVTIQLGTFTSASVLLTVQR